MNKQIIEDAFNSLPEDVDGIAMLNPRGIISKKLCLCNASYKVSPASEDEHEDKFIFRCTKCGHEIVCNIWI